MSTIDDVISGRAKWCVVTGDCLDVLRTIPAGSVDAVVTDPPYGIGRDGKRASTSAHGGFKEYEFKGWDANRPSSECFALMLRSSPSVVIWGGNYFADLLPPTAGWLVWDKAQRLDQADGELAWTTKDGAMRIFTRNRVALKQDGAVHPTQKPVSLMRWSIDQVSDKADALILDPFCGSGTTGVACMQTGRRFIGIEIDEGYAAIARRRISEAANHLFQETPK